MFLKVDQLPTRNVHLSCEYYEVDLSIASNQARQTEKSTLMWP